MQVKPMNPKLKAPGTKRLKLFFVNLLSSFAFDFNLRRYIKAVQNGASSPLKVRRCKLNRYNSC